jgi:hypothetical protein
MMILKSVFIIVMAVTLIGIISIPNVSADVMCIQQVVWTPQDSDYGIELCEQDDLWDEVNAIWDYLGMNVGVSNTNTDTVSINLERLTMQNNELNRKITLMENKFLDLENKFLDLENMQKTEQKSSCWFFC